MAMIPSHVSDFRSPWWGERRSRYHLVAKYVRAAKVLDVASHPGDASILRDAGAESTVVVMNEGPIGAKPSRVDVLLADTTALPFLSGSFDVTSCLEISLDAKLAQRTLSEFRRILRPGGKTIVSVANRDHDPWAAERRSETRVYDANALQDMLSRDFSSLEIVGQFPDRRYPFAPFWQQADDVRHHSLRAASWLFRHRMPHTIKDGLERLIRNRAFYPGEYDFVFTDQDREKAHRLIAIATR